MVWARSFTYTPEGRAIAYGLLSLPPEGRAIAYDEKADFLSS